MEEVALRRCGYMYCENDPLDGMTMITICDKPATDMFVRQAPYHHNKKTLYYCAEHYEEMKEQLMKGAPNESS